ncbi:MAG: cytochrome c [Pseudomonadota bacterium]
MKHALIPGVLLVTSVCHAGDIAKGQSAYSYYACVSCHGDGGQSQVDIYPTLAGKSAAFITEQLTRFRSGQRSNATMNVMSSPLSDSDIENIAAYLAAQ